MKKGTKNTSYSLELQEGSSWKVKSSDKEKLVNAFPPIGEGEKKLKSLEEKASFVGIILILSLIAELANCLRIIRPGRWTIVFLPVIMGSLFGHEFLRRQRREQSFELIPLIVKAIRIFEGNYQAISSPLLNSDYR